MTYKEQVKILRILCFVVFLLVALESCPPIVAKYVSQFLNELFDNLKY